MEITTAKFIAEYKKLKLREPEKRGKYKRVIKITSRNLEIVAAYKKHKILQLAANELGITRERVRQVTNKFLDDPEVLAIKNKYDHSNERCLICNRSFIKVPYGGKGICAGCVSYRRSKRKHRRRNLYMPNNCKGCKVTFTNKYPFQREPGDLCNKCFSKTERYKINQRRWRAKNKDKVYTRIYKYYKEVWAPKNREKIRQYHRTNYAKNKEKILAKARERYQQDKNYREYRQESFKQRYIKRLLN